MISSSTSYPHWTQVYGEGAGKDEYPRVYQSPTGGAFVCLSDGITQHFNCNGTWTGRSSVTSRECEQDQLRLLTGPEAAECVAAAREVRDAVWLPKVSEWPKVMKGEDHDALGRVWVYFGETDGVVLFNDGNKYKVESSWTEIFDGEGLITDPTLRAKYIAAAEAFRAKDADPWPHWWTRKDGAIEWLWEVSSDGAVVRHDKHEAENQEVAKHGDLIASEYGHRRIPAPEAAALLAKWEAERTPPPALPGAEDPTPEAIATDFVNSQCGIGRPAVADPDQQVRLSYVVGLIANAIHRDRRLRDGNAILHSKIAKMEKHLRWIAYEPIGPANNTAEAILDEITNTTRAVIFELAKPECRVKHDWTGAMGTVLMEHDGTAFVKWDDGQVTSVYSRHLQKELQ